LREAHFRHVLRLGSLLCRLTMATIATALVALAVGSIARLTLLVLLLTGTLTVELRTTRRTP